VLATPEPAVPPRVWLLVGDKLGDNAQAVALADAIGWPYEVRQVFPKPEWVLGKPHFEPGLHHLDLERSARLEPPWPDIVLTIGRRPSMAALWVQDRSGGRTRVVLIGRPKRWIERFALVVVPGQFQVPERGNVAHLALPLMRVDRAKVAAAAEAWRQRLEDLPRPLTAVLVGGETKPYRFDAGVAATLLERLRELRQRDDGTLYLTTSRRTRPDVVDALARGLPEGALLYRWGPAAGENPYLGLLGLADRFVVTGDSISMMVEVASLGRPLAIFGLPVAREIRSRLRATLTGLLGGRERRGLASALAHLGHRLGLVGYGRDLTAVHRLLYRRGLAVPVGQPFQAPAGRLEDELAAVVERICALA
jgi:mitochondrial fission protein ELM1